MSRDGRSRGDGRKVWDGRIAQKLCVMHMNDRLHFTLEVDGLTFEGDNPKELHLKAEMALLGEATAIWQPIALVERELREGALIYARLFVARANDESLYRRWRIDGKDEDAKNDWYSARPKSYSLLEVAGPGARSKDEPRDKHSVWPYTPALWDALNKLDDLLRTTQERVAARIRELMERADAPAILPVLSMGGPQALVRAFPSKDNEMPPPPPPDPTEQ